MGDIGMEQGIQWSDGVEILGEISWNEGSRREIFRNKEERTWVGDIEG